MSGGIGAAIKLAPVIGCFHRELRRLAEHTTANCIYDYRVGTFFTVGSDADVVAIRLALESDYYASHSNRTMVIILLT